MRTLTLVPPGLLLLLLAPLVSSGCASTKGRVSGDAVAVEDMLARGQFEEAVRKAASLREKHPGEEEYEFLHRKASLGYLLEAGRKATLADRDEEALDIFQRATEVAPDSVQAQEWLQKTRSKLALHWNVIGEELHAEGVIEEALEAYQKALDYDPEMLSAREGASQLVLLMNYRLGLSERYYNEGVRALHDYYLRVSRGRFVYITKKYEPGDERADSRKDEVETMIADQRYAQAGKLERDGQYAASRNEYYIVLLMRPGDAEAQAGYDRMKVESMAKRKFDEAAMMAMRKDFDGARARLQEGRDVTVEQLDVFDDAIANIEDQRIRSLYDDAVLAERDFQYEAAIAIYEHILSERQWFEDARTRLETAQRIVADAADLYSKAQTAATDEERLALLRQLEVTWPDYKDARDQLTALLQKLGPQEKTDGGK
jgi:tetratricopeptide (TPR) repeat protein